MRRLRRIGEHARRYHYDRSPWPYECRFVDQETGSIHYWNEEGQKYAVWDEDCGLRIPPFIVEKLAIGMEDANAAPAEVASTAEVSTGQRGEEQFGLGQTELEQIAKDTGLKLDHLLLFNSGVKCYAFVKVSK